MLPQFLFISGGIISIPFLFYLAWQGKKIRATVPSLPEAHLNKSGKTGSSKNSLSIILLGESTMAGVGISDHKKGIAGQLAQRLHALTHKSIHWKVVARSGATAAIVRKDLVPTLPEAAVDLIVIGLGANDIFALHSPARWRKDLHSLLLAVRAKQPKAAIVISPMPPIGQFPAFPRSIRLVLGNIAKLYAMTTAQIAKKMDQVYFIDAPIVFKKWEDKTPYSKVEDFFSDGVHPSAISYQLWGDEVADFVEERQLVN